MLTASADSQRPCFVENLTVRTFLSSVFPHLVRRLAKREKVTTCYVFASSRIAMVIARAIARWAGTKVERLDFRLIDVRDEAGLLIRLRIPFQDLAEVQREITNGPVFRNFVDGKFENSRVAAFLAKSVLGADSRASLSGGLWRALFLIEVCAWKRRHSASRIRDVTMFMQRRAWMANIAAYGLGAGVTVLAVMPGLNVVHLRLFLIRVLGPRRILMIRNLLHALSGHRRVTVRRPERSGTESVKSQTSHRARVAVQHFGQLNLRRPEMHSDLFFWQEARFPGRDLVVVFWLAGDPLDEAKLAELSEYDIDAVALNPWVTRVPGAHIFSPRPRLRSPKRERPAGVFRLTRPRELASLRAHLASYHDQREYWTEFFQTYDIKIYVSWYHADARNAVIADAIQAVGGVAIIYQRSFESLPSPDVALATDIAFGFSLSGAEREAQSGSIIPCYLVTGYLGDHRFPMLKERAGGIRDAFHGRGATHIVSFFDENSANDPRWHTGHDLQREGYAFLLEKVLSESWLGLVIKPKVPATIRRRLGPVAELLARAEATGRCYLFEEGKLQGSFPPAAAALVSDVAIHGHLSGATAGLEAALAGVPTVLLDREGWHVSPLYRLGVGHVVFKDCDSLWNALSDHWKSPGGVPGFGDWSPMLDELDPFRDGRAAERMGTYIRWLLEGFKAGLDRETVMADAAERYRVSWGKDKVVTVRPSIPSFEGAVNSL